MTDPSDYISSSVSAMIVDTPLGGHDRLRFTSVRLHIEHFGEREGVGEIGVLRGTLGILSFMDADGHHTIGSAAIVGPGLALCADHVIDHYIEGIRRGETTVVCHAPAGDELLVWVVRSITKFQDTDLAALSMSLMTAPPTHGPFITAHLTTRMPAIGDRLFLCGYTPLEMTQPRGHITQVNGTVRFTTGEVIDAWPYGRDRVMIPGPTLAVDCGAAGGMSGGPVFDERGYLVGVVSSSSVGVETAYVSHIWPALSRYGIQIFWPRERPGTTSLLHLGQAFGVSIERPDAFSLEVRRGELVLQYDAWS